MHLNLYASLQQRSTWKM